MVKKYKNNSILIWLKFNLIEIKDIKNAVIFGSMAKDKLNPADCDLLILTNVIPGSESWYSIRNNLNIISNNFEKYWNLKLSIVIMTIDEFKEITPLNKSIISNPIINILGILEPS